MKPPDESHGDLKSRRLGEALTLGYTLTAGMLFFTLIGVFLDKKMGTESAWTLGGMFMGLFYGGYEIWKFARRFQEDDSSS